MTEVEFDILSRAIFLQKNEVFKFDDGDDFWEQEKSHFHFTIEDFNIGFNDLCNKEYLVDLDGGIYVGVWRVSQKGLLAHVKEIAHRLEVKGEKQLDNLAKTTSIYAPRRANSIAIAALVVATIGTVFALFALLKEEPKQESVDLQDYVKKEEVQKMLDNVQIEVLDKVYGDTSFVRKK